MVEVVTEAAQQPKGNRGKEQREQNLKICNYYLHNSITDPPRGYRAAQNLEYFQALRRNYIINPSGIGAIGAVELPQPRHSFEAT